MINTNDAKTTLENVLMMAIKHTNENKGLSLIEDLGAYLVGSSELDKSTSLLFQEFNLETVCKDVPKASVMNFCINFIDIVIAEAEKILPPVQDRQMVIGKDFETLEIYNRGYIVKNRLEQYFRIIYKG